MSWRDTTAQVLAGASVVGIAALVVERLGLGAHLNQPRLSSTSGTGISILKPLCGVDDGLAESLELFANLPYAPYELILGVRDTSDAAYPLAADLARRYPERVSVVLQDGEPGLNPKVNQLISMKPHAKYDVLLISDSNVRPGEGYLDELAAIFEDPDVGCATNPLSGAGHKTLGSMMENMNLSAMGAGTTVAKSLGGMNLVIGKSEALRKSTIEALGGFEAYKDVLAEDYIIGRDVGRKLGQKVVYGTVPVFNVSVNRTVQQFYERNARWNVIQSTSVDTPLSYLAMGLLNPIPLAALAWLLAPSDKKLKLLAGVTVGKVAIDMSNAQALGVSPLGLSEAVSVPLKDGLLFGAWARGFFVRKVKWRGTQLNVGEGSTLTLPEGQAIPPPSTTPTTEDCFFSERPNRPHQRSSLRRKSPARVRR